MAAAKIFGGEVFDAVATRLDHKRRAVPPAMARGIDRGAAFIAERGAANAPVQSGALQSTVQAHPAEVSGTTAAALVTAGGPTAPYALTVHERPPYEDGAHVHEGTPEGYPGSRFLSRPARMHHGVLRDDVVEEVVTALKEEE